MDHVAIMKKSWGLIPRILSGEKTIESRWSQTRRAPWNTISVGDTVYFKNSGEPITARAMVAKVLQFEIKSKAEAQNIVSKYGKKICLLNTKVETWGSVPKYCILVELSNPHTIEPFNIDKTGFGIGCAWISIPKISKIKK